MGDKSETIATAAQSTLDGLRAAGKSARVTRYAYLAAFCPQGEMFVVQRPDETKSAYTIRVDKRVARIIFEDESEDEVTIRIEPKAESKE